MILIDGEPLDQVLDRACPGLELNGLVPTWLDWMNDDADQEVAHERMEPPTAGRLRVPLLICPDDLDFSCTTVIADLIGASATVEWTRLGLDRTKSLKADDVGRDVEWFDGVGPMTFERGDYEACVRTFRGALTNNRQAGA